MSYINKPNCLFRTYKFILSLTFVQRFDDSQFSFSKALYYDRNDASADYYIVCLRKGHQAKTSSGYLRLLSSDLEVEKYVKP